MTHPTLYPGDKFPRLEFPGGIVIDSDVVARSKNALLVVIYRGHFCPFCQATMEHLKKEHENLVKAGIDLVAISADKKKETDEFIASLGGLPFPVGHSMSVETMKKIGLFISHPTHYIHQEHDFSEPAWFLLYPENEGKIKYLCYGSAPFSGRPVIGDLISGYEYAVDRAKNEPNFAKVAWGGVKY